MHSFWTCVVCAASLSLYVHAVLIFLGSFIFNFFINGRAYLGPVFWLLSHALCSAYIDFYMLLL